MMIRFRMIKSFVCFNFTKLTHKKLKCYVVHEDMVQWDYTQLAEICRKLQSINFLQNKDDQGKEKNCYKCLCVIIWGSYLS